MKSTLIIILVLLAGIHFTAYGQYSGKRASLSLNYNYTTTAKLYYTPNSSDPIMRNNYDVLEDIWSPSIDFRFRFTDDLSIGLSTELLEKTTPKRIQVTIRGVGVENIRADDGFRVIPFELSLYYLLPFSTARFKVFMGGGGAYYYGSHVRKIGNAELSNVSREFAYGIQVSVSSDYMIYPFLSIRAEMKFRDPEMKVSSRYNKREFTLDGVEYLLPSRNFDSKINVDGSTFTLGAAFHF